MYPFIRESDRSRCCIDATSINRRFVEDVKGKNRKYIGHKLRGNFYASGPKEDA